MRLFIILSLCLSASLVFSSFPVDGESWRTGGTILIENPDNVQIIKKNLTIRFKKNGAKVHIHYEIQNRGPEKSIALGLPLFFNFNDTGLAAPSGSLAPYAYQIRVNNKTYPYKPVTKVSANAQNLLRKQKNSPEDQLEIKEGQLRFLRSEINFKSEEKKILTLSYFQPYCFVTLQTEGGKLIPGSRQFFYLFHSYEFLNNLTIQKLTTRLDFTALPKKSDIVLNPKSQYTIMLKKSSRQIENFFPRPEDNLEVYLEW